MKVLLHSHAFWPSIGGVETIAETLAENIVALGHGCTVVTETTGGEDRSFPFPVVRRPSISEKLNLIRGHDLVHANGTSMRLYWLARAARRPFVWTHNGYQAACIDGLGWSDGKPTPITPWASFEYYWRKRGPAYACREGLKLLLRRHVAEHADFNIAATQWVAKKLKLKNEIVAYTPYNLKRFSSNGSKSDAQFVFLFVGRLVSEKGVRDLLLAFRKVIEADDLRGCRLAVVGDGPERQSLQTLATDLGVEELVTFFGAKTGGELQAIIDDSRIAVIPSVWEEPMGGVSLELMKSGKNLIVSRFGGHTECVGDAGLTFKNGDFEELSRCMMVLARDRDLRNVQREKAEEQLKKFDELALTKRYIEIYRSLID